MSTRSTFPLRFHDDSLRELVREVAKRDHVSQNDLIEQAVRNEVVSRGGALARDLARAAARIAELSDVQLGKLVELSITDAADGEGEAEPLQAVALHTVDTPTPRSDRGAAPLALDRLGVMAAFDAGRRT